MNVVVYFDNGAPVSAQFDVAPRLGELLIWHDPHIGASASHKVISVMHEGAVPDSFQYVIGITRAT